MAVRKLTPIDMAIGTIDETIAELKLQRNELVALLPKRPAKPDNGYIVDPRNGEKRWYNKHLQRRYEAKKRGLKKVKG